MARARFQRLPAERRDAILDAAAARFAESGFEGASYNRILDDAELPKSSAYYLFDGKADLYGEVLEREARRFAEALPAPAAASDPPSFWGETRRWLEASLGWLATHPRSARLLAGYAEARRGGLIDLDARIGAALDDAVAGFVAAGRAVGAVRIDVPEALAAGLASAALATLDLHYLPILAEAEPGEAAAAFDLYLDTLRRLLEP